MNFVKICKYCETAIGNIVYRHSTDAALFCQYRVQSVHQIR